MLRNNKILILLFALACVVIALILGGVYFFTQRSDGSGEITDDIAVDFAPFGQGDDNPNAPSIKNGSTTPELPVRTGPTPIPLLRKLSNVPVAAFTAGNTSKGTDGALVSYARFMERATGHVFEIPLALMTPAVKISNTTIPRIQEAVWAPDGKYVAIRYFNEKMEHVSTYLAKLVFTNTSIENELHLEETVSASTTLQGVFLDNDIPALAFSPDGSSLFYLIRTTAGARGYIRSIDKKTNKLVFSSPLSELLPTWDSQNNILLSTKPSASVPGYVFSLNLKTGAVGTIFTELPSVMARSNSTYDQALFFSAKDSVPLLNLLNLKTQEVSGIQLSTLPEKCTWSKRERGIAYCAVPAIIPQGAYPDTWYRGEVTYSDIIWRINTETNTQDIVVVPTTEVSEAIDAVNLALSPEEDFLLFIDKEDGILWSTKLRDPIITSAPTATSTQTTQ